MVTAQAIILEKHHAAQLDAEEHELICFLAVAALTFHSVVPILAFHLSCIGNAEMKCI